MNPGYCLDQGHGGPDRIVEEPHESVVPVVVEQLAGAEDPGGRLTATFAAGTSTAVHQHLERQKFAGTHADSMSHCDQSPEVETEFQPQQPLRRECELGLPVRLMVAFLADHSELFPDHSAVRGHSSAADESSWADHHLDACRAHSCHHPERFVLAEE